MGPSIRGTETRHARGGTSPTTWGHKNIQNTRIYAQISHPLREQVFRELERHPKIVRIA